MADEHIPEKPKWGNCHVGKRAQRIERMRAKLWQWIDSKKGADRDALIAMKMVMELDGITGVKVSESGGKREPRLKPKPQPAIKVPALLETA